MNVKPGSGQKEGLIPNQGEGKVTWFLPHRSRKALTEKIQRYRSGINMFFYITAR